MEIFLYLLPDISSNTERRCVLQDREFDVHRRVVARLHLVVPQVSAGICTHIEVANNMLEAGKVHTTKVSEKLIPAIVLHQ